MDVDARTQEAIELLERLVATPSPSGEEHNAVNRLVDWMGSRGLDAGADAAGNAVGVAGSGPREILLLGHIDTFPGAPPVHRRANLLYGRGAVDAKGSLCTFAAAAAAVVVPDEWRITVVGAVEEETTESRGAHHLLDTRHTQPPPAYCIIGEPSRWDRITLGYKGNVRVEAQVRAPYAHSAGQHRLPAEWGVATWNAISAWCDDRNRTRGPRIFDQVTPALTAINTEDDGTYGFVTLHVGLRLPLSETPSRVEADLPNAVLQLLRAATGEAPPDICYTFRGATAAHRGGKSTPLVRAFLRSIRRSGGDPRFVVKTGTSDMNVVGPAWPDTPIVAYGPGDSALDHTPDEHIDLDEYVKAIVVLQNALETVMATSA